MDVPPEHRRAAEEIRAHLVAVRGGGLFLSSADARTLVKWLDDGTSVVAIAAAIERAAEARRKNRARAPLTLARAKRHLGKAPYQPQPVAISGSDHPFGAALDALRAAGAPELAGAIESIDEQDADDRVRQALVLVRGFLARQWEALGDSERARRLAIATVELDGLDLSEVELALHAEELVRDEIRRAWPMLEAAYLWTLSHGAPS